MDIPDTPDITDLSDAVGSKTELNELILQELRDFKKSFKAEIKEELKENRTEMLKDIHNEIEVLVGKIDKTNEDVQAIKKESQETNKKINFLEGKVETLEAKLSQSEQTILLLENKLRERSIKLRGVPEEKEENLFEKVIPLIARFIDMEEDYLETQVEKIFRINTKIAREKKLPRDILIGFVNIRIKEEILQQSYKDKLMIEDNVIEIFKDLPPQTLKRRQDFKFLTDILQDKDISYRWNKTEGVSVLYNQKRHLINTTEKAKVFLTKLNLEGIIEQKELYRNPNLNKQGRFNVEGKNTTEGKINHKASKQTFKKETKKILEFRQKRERRHSH